MAQKTHVWKEHEAETDDTTIVSVTVENGRQSTRCWYSVSTEHSSLLTKSSDPFVLATIFKAMHEQTDLIVHGEVSPSLLTNLEEFQSAWNSWRPEQYTVVEIIADAEREQPKASDSDEAVVAFSGGVDSCFTAWRYRNAGFSHSMHNLRAGVMVHGFDIPLKESDTWISAASKAREMLSSLGMQLIPITTNFKELGDKWGLRWKHTHGAAVASCLMILQGRYVAGYIPSSSPYNRLTLPWGSNPITDSLMSSNSFKIIHDGASYIRREKLRKITKWPEAMRYLRVCWEGIHHDRNCGKCEKCIRTILSSRVMGLGLPECFEQDVHDNQILALKGLSGARLYYLEEILLVAKAAPISESWVVALEKCIKQNRRTAQAKQSLWQKIRRKATSWKRLHRIEASK